MGTTTTHIHDYLAAQASEQPDKPALICDDRTLTFAQLWTEVREFAGYLAPQLSKDKQEVVAILLPNSWQFVVAHLGTLLAGHINMPIDPTYKKLEIGGITAQQRPAHVITHAGAKDEFNPEFAFTIIENEPWKDANPIQNPLRLPAEEQIATLLFTSGTTGKPKITAYSHANHMWNPSVLGELWQWTSDDTLLMSTPLSHWHGLAVILNGGLYYGNTIYIQERFSPEETLQKLESGDISLYMHVPIAYYKMVEHAPDKQYDLSKVRLFVSGSSYLPPAIWHQFKQRFGHEILERYGSSETGLIASNRLGERIPGSVGYLLPDVDVKIIDGELAMKSPGRFVGYYGNPEATNAKITADGYWMTGDLGEFDANGRLTLHGRVQEKMKKNGYTVFPRDIEWALMKDARISDAFVLGLQDKNALSDRIVYFIVGDITEEAVTQYCKKNLPAAWRPDMIRFLDAIPKSPAGKPKLAVLRASVENE